MHSYENSRPYGQQRLATHRAGHLALPKEFLNNPFSLILDLSSTGMNHLLHTAGDRFAQKKMSFYKINLKVNTIISFQIGQGLYPSGRAFPSTLSLRTKCRASPCPPRRAVVSQTSRRPDGGVCPPVWGSP